MSFCCFCSRHEQLAFLAYDRTVVAAWEKKKERERQEAARLKEQEVRDRSENSQLCGKCFFQLICLISQSKITNQASQLMSQDTKTFEFTEVENERNKGKGLFKIVKFELLEKKEEIDERESMV